MIDERFLADPTRCPSCAAPLAPAPTVCPACRLPLAGSVASRLLQVSVEAAGLLARRSELLSTLRAQAFEAVYDGAPAAPVTPQVTPVTAPGAPPPGPPPGQPRAARPEWTPRRVQNLLLVLGAGLLGVAAVIFVAVSWGRLGVGGRAAVMTGLTAVAAYAGLTTWRRGLTATAEALSLLTVGLALLDCAGARASDLFGLGSVDGSVVAAGSAALVALAAGAGSTVLPTRSLRLSAAVLAQVALPLLLGEAAQDVDNPAALVATGLSAQAFVALATVALWRPRSGAAGRDARAAVAAGGALAALVAAAAALAAAYVEDGSLVAGTALLLVAAVGLAVAGELLAGRHRAAAVGLRGVVAALAVAAVWAPVVDGVSQRWLPVALATAALVLLTATRAVPADRRTAPGAVLLAAACLPALAAAEAVLAAVLGRMQWLDWLDRAWTLTGSTSVRESLSVPGLDGLVLVTLTEPPTVLLLVVSVALAVGAALVPGLRRARTVAVPVAATAGILAAPALGSPYALALGVDLGLALALLVAGALLVRSRRPGTGGSGAAALASGSVVLGLAVAWSLAVDVATLVALPAAASVLLVAVAAGHGVQRLRGPRVAAGIAAGLLLVGEAGAFARYAGSGWPGTTSLMLALLAAAGVLASLVVAVRAPAGRFWAALRRGLAVTGVAAVLAEAGALSWWQGAGVPGAGLAVAVTAAALVAVSTVPVPSRFVTVGDLRLVAGAGGLLALLASAEDADRLWTALLALGVGAAVLGVRDDHRWGWLAGALLTASSGVRLALAEVDAPEAYTVPPALALLAVGFLRRRRDPSYHSWRAYASGLALALVPSLLRAVTDAGELRPFLLGSAALVVLAVGAARRLQAPLVLGAGVLAVDATVQLAPYLATAYDAVPRWVTIGMAGLVLLGSGATFEQRVRDVRRAGRHVTRMG